MTINSEEFTPSTLEERIIAKAIEDPAYKQRLLNDAKAVVEEELGEKLSDDVTIQVLQQSANHLYLVLPTDLDQLVREGIITQEELEAVAGGLRIRITKPGNVKSKSELLQSVSGISATISSVIGSIYYNVKSRKG
ncbi:NHLP leader peptide family natural product precursor [Nostoc sp. FACHB-87]|uniref:NHLP leader peptide family RiPP precursor n=1 Tax=Nostocales TaxID=1161 RepID=UPI00168677E3|nr:MULTISPECIES: NHLP leader peptide family RiPP precursor [Nostocales]MBD2299667.1 NHLP leader peptide family natural product precursor [Nostoc sp. FACHB-190]MBD2457485.1 NHLP leader peptide family natural product precursor [Nostoc sp. FACHB-87]MBD2477547.1 NHLP leader peptide family natural product precursor [Anabaena sp. FACHB-83]MBD2489574.1 NHLP leader peptide family natural product precursor [Aulosira sp. FACHB-615]